jgi:hypothetical protein
MRKLIGLPTVLLLSAFCAGQRVSPAELQHRADEASGTQCAQLSLQASRGSLEAADRLFRDGNIEDAHSAIDVSLHYAERSVDCTLQARKHAKNVEIVLREFIRRMNDVRHTLDADDRPHLEQAQIELEKQRDRLLLSMFGPAAEGVAENPR